MKMLFSGKGGVDPRDLNLEDMREGWQVGFGFMMQSGLSGRRFTVTDLRRYRFGNDTYTSYTLEDNDYKIQMVPARDHAGISYIAVSRVIEIGDLAQLIDTNVLQGALEKEGDATIDVQSSLRPLKGWVATKYHRALRKVEGTVSSSGVNAQSIFGHAEKQVGARRIFYSLFVNAEGTHALEVEQFANGRRQVYATVYRPATDIGQITRPHRAAPERSVKLESETVRKPVLREVPLTLDNGKNPALAEDRIVHTPPALVEVEKKDEVAAPASEAGKEEKSVDAAPQKAETAGDNKTESKQSEETAKKQEKKNTEDKPVSTVATAKEKDGKSTDDKKTAQNDNTRNDHAGEETAEKVAAVSETTREKSKKEKRQKKKEQRIREQEEKKQLNATQDKEAKADAVVSAKAEMVAEAATTAIDLTENGAGALVAAGLQEQKLPVAAEQAQELAVSQSQAVLAPAESEAQMVNCNMRVAGKVIDEALRSGLTLTQVVRKAMDLPAVFDETIQLRLKLTEQDRRELAKRYGVDAEDPKAIAEVINRELSFFAGDNKA